MEPVEYKGKWWKPEDKDNVINGIFSFDSNNGGRLELDGILKGDIHSTIHGVSNNGKQITLNKCFTTKRPIFRTGGQEESSVYVNRAYIGALLNDENKFFKAKFRTILLDEWVNISGFEIDHILEKHQVKINYTIPDSVEIYNVNGTNISIEISAKTPSLNFVQKEAAIYQKTFLTINSDKDKEISFFFDLIFKIQNFISLATLKPVVPIEVFVFCKEIFETYNDKKYPSKIELLYLATGEKKEYDVLPPNMLFSYKDIKGTIIPKITTWLEKYDDLSPIFNLFFGDMYRPSGYIDRKFLGLVQAIESYHRRTSSNIEIPEDAHKERIKSIISSVPREYITWLENKLCYSNEPSLRVRLKEIYDKNDVILKKFIKKKEFVNLSVNTRNYLTHYDKSLENSTASSNKLVQLVEIYKTLLLICMLREIDFSEKEIIAVSVKFDIHKMEFT